MQMRVVSKFKFVAFCINLSMLLGIVLASLGINHDWLDLERSTETFRFLVAILGVFVLKELKIITPYTCIILTITWLGLFYSFGNDPKVWWMY